MYFTPMLQQSRTSPPKDLDASLYASAPESADERHDARAGGSGKYDAGEHGMRNFSFSGIHGEEKCSKLLRTSEGTYVGSE